MRKTALTFLATFLVPVCLPQLQAVTVKAVAWSRMPTSAGATNEWFTGFSNAAINDTGTVAFGASVTTVSTGFFAVPLIRTASPAGATTNVVTLTNSTVSLPRFTNTWNGIWTLSPKGSRSLIASSGFRSYPIIADMGGFNSLGNPILNNSDLCVFAGNYSPGFIYPPPALPGAMVTNFYGGQGVWVSTNTWSPVAFVGESAPGYANPFSSYVGTSSGLFNLSSTNGVQLSTSPDTFTNWPTFSSIDRIALPDTGNLLFSATVTATNYYYPQPSSNGMAMPLSVAIQPLLQHGIWGQDSTGHLTEVIREGDSLMIGKSNRTVVTLTPRSTLFPVGCVNPLDGETAVNAIFDDGTQGVLVASPRSNSLVLAALTGDAAPGGGSGDFFLSFSAPSINAAGHVAFCGTAGFVTPFPIVYASLTPSTNMPARSPGFTNNWTGLWAEDPAGNPKLIARIAPPIPDLGGFTSLNSPLINSMHQVAFRGTYRKGFFMTPPGMFAGGDGVWTSLNVTNPIVWVGQTAPGYPTNFSVSVKSPYEWSTKMITFRSAPPVISSIEKFAFPDTSRAVVWATASVTNDVPRPPVPKGMVVTQQIRSAVFHQRGIWIANSKGTMDLALREGMSVPVNGTSKVISSLSQPSTTSMGSTESLCSRSNGLVITTVTFTDGSQAVLRITP